MTSAGVIKPKFAMTIEYLFDLNKPLKKVPDETVLSMRTLRSGNIAVLLV